jgi:hypothetical protein
MKRRSGGDAPRRLSRAAQAAGTQKLEVFTVPVAGAVSQVMGEGETHPPARACKSRVGPVFRSVMQV